MKRIIIIGTLIFTLTLSACAASGPQTVTGAAANSGAALPQQTQLILGTLNLEGTENAVTAEQAAELLPMWYVLKDISASDTAAQEEIDGLVSQIQETMTEAQTQAITDMNLSPRDMMAVMQINGVSAGGTRPTTSQSGQNAQGVPSGFGAGGPPPDMAGGGFPSGGFPAG